MQSSLEKAQEYETAILTYLKLIEKRPRSKNAPYAQYQIGNIYNYNLKRYQEAVIAYQKTVSFYPDSEYSFKAQYEIAEIYNKRFDEKHLAIIEYERLFKYKSFRSEFPKVHLRIIDCYLHLKQYDKAIYELKLLRKETPSYPENDYLLFKEGLIQYQKSDFKSAKDVFETFLATYPNSDYFIKAQYWYAQTLEELKFFERALETYKLLLEKEYKKEIVKEKIAKITKAIEEEKKKLKNKRK